jgi:farnesyl-diphosphate farnesyltransferase
MERDKHLNYDSHLDSILKGVSRSFYLTLRFLPSAVRHQISIAYLIARAADTVADTNIMPVEHRIQALKSIRNSTLTESAETDFLLPFITDNGAADFSSDEMSLLKNFAKVMAVYRHFPPQDRELIKKVIADITTGQELDLLRFSAASINNIVPLSDDDELDKYTFYVAGTVGEFWTRMCFLHILNEQKLPKNEMVSSGIRYGKGLQLINILRDIPFDLRKGRCYIPSRSLNAFNLQPSDLLDIKNEEKFRPVYNRYLKLAVGHLECGKNYIFNIPKRYFRLRFVTALPLLIGIKTLEKLLDGKILAEKKIKISRASVKKLMLLCLLFYPIEPLWKTLFCSERLDKFTTQPD